MSEDPLNKLMREQLRIKITCDLDYLGTPIVRVMLLLNDAVISKSEAAIPEAQPYSG